MAEPADPPRRRSPSTTWRVAVLAVTGFIAAISAAFGVIIAITPCRGDVCVNEAGWVVLLAAALLLGAGILTATGRTAAPLYVVGAYFGGGLTAQALIARGSPPDLLFAALFVLGLVALLDLRRQTRSTFAASAAVIALGILVPISTRYPAAGWFVIVLGVLPILVWALTRWRDRARQAQTG